MRMIQQMISWLPQLLNGAKITILLTLCAVSMGLLLSIFLALGKMSKNRILSGYAVSTYFSSVEHHC